MESNTRILWVHNFATHYTVRLFQLISERLPLEFLFFSPGRERFWLTEHGTQRGAFPHRYLRGVQIAGTRFVPSLPVRLLSKKYAVIIKCINGKFALPITYLAARLSRTPFVLYTGIWMRIDTLMHRLAFPFLRHIYRHADAIIVYGQHVKRYLVGEGVQPSRIFVEPHSVDNRLYSRPVSEKEKAAVFEWLSLPQSTKMVLYVGRLVPEKGLEHLITAFAHLHYDAVALVIAGTGSEGPRLKQMALRLGLSERARFPGYFPPDQTVALYAAAWVFVLPSVTTRRDKEPWGLVVNEAFNQGLPVIATEAVGAAAGGLIENLVNGLIIPEGDPFALAQALRTVLSDSLLRKSMSASAQRKIKEWDQEHAAELIERAIRSVLPHDTSVRAAQD